MVELVNHGENQCRRKEGHTATDNSFIFTVICLILYGNEPSKLLSFLAGFVPLIGQIAVKIKEYVLSTLRVTHSSCAYFCRLNSVLIAIAALCVTNGMKLELHKGPPPKNNGMQNCTDKAGNTDLLYRVVGKHSGTVHKVLRELEYYVI